MYQIIFLKEPMAMLLQNESVTYERMEGLIDLNWSLLTFFNEEMDKKGLGVDKNQNDVDLHEFWRPVTREIVGIQISNFP